MKATQHTTYNKKNITLNITEIAKPSITDKEVLVKVTAAGVNPLDNMISRGEVKMIVPYKLPQLQEMKWSVSLKRPVDKSKISKSETEFLDVYHLIILAPLRNT